MKKTQHPDNNLQFLAAGGEMGEFMRAKDWSITSLDSPGQWPQSLRTVISIILNSKFPMLLFWGPELICFYNDAFRPSLGINGKHPGMLGQKGEEAWAEIWHIIKPWIDSVLATKEAIWYEDQLVPFYRNGRMEDIYWTFSYSPVNDESGEAAGVFVTCSETTETVLTRKKVQENEEKMNIILESSELGIWELNLKTDTASYSDRYLQLFGYEKGAYPDHAQLIKHIHPDDLPARAKALKESLKTGSLYYSCRIVWNDGSIHWIEAKGSVIYDDKKEPSLITGTLRDIQEQKDFANELEKQVEKRTKELTHINESLKKSEERYHLMVEEVQDYAILYLNREGIVENWNNGAEKIKGYTANEIIGKSFSVFYTAHDRHDNLPHKLLAEAVRTGRARQQGWRVRKDGTFFWASVVITAVHDEANNVIGFSKVTHDLTDKKEADDKIKATAAEMEQKNIELEKMNKELQSFAYISSHDLQEPLRKIQTFASRIIEKEENNLSDSGKDYFKRMQNAAMRMQILIDDLLAYSRTNSAERKYEHTDLNKVVEEVKADLKEELHQKHATIEYTRMCDADIIPFQFRQLLHNLISNSLKFSSPAHAPHIKISSELGTGEKFKVDKLLDDARYCHISFEDNGIGFEQEYSEKIFEVFQRLHGRSQYSGTGIGLAIVKKIIDNHNGVITAKAELNKGARFDIYIPTS